MILDSIKNISRYENLNIDFKSIVEFIKRVNNENLDNGRYDINGDKLFALVQSYETKDSNECKLESHKKYIDIQYILKGTEVMYWSLIDNLKISTLNKIKVKREGKITTILPKEILLDDLLVL